MAITLPFRVQRSNGRNIPAVKAVGVIEKVVDKGAPGALVDVHTHVCSGRRVAT